MKLQLRAIGHSTDIDQLVNALTADHSLRLARVQRGYTAREADAERAYIDIEQRTPATAEGSAA